jgi:hypothetical protein
MLRKNQGVGGIWGRREYSDCLTVLGIEGIEVCSNVVEMVALFVYFF